MIKKTLKASTRACRYLVALPLLFVAKLSLAAPEAAAAAASTPAKHGSVGSMIWLPLILIAVFYFLIIRPQNKRQREHKNLMKDVSMGDEVMTNAGILGKITRLRDSYIVLSVSKDQEMTFSRNAISQVLPKGTIESIN